MAKLKEFDPSAYLTNDEVVAEYLTAALEDPNPDVFLAAVGNVAKARGMSSIAEESGLGRQTHGLCGLTMRCSIRRLSSRRLQQGQTASRGFDQQAARRLRAAADRGR
jgi:hypothetical protein